MKILYSSEAISFQNKNEFFSMDESLINHKNGRQIWLLGVINNQNKNFRIEGTFNRDTTAISKFIKETQLSRTCREDIAFWMKLIQGIRIYPIIIIMEYLELIYNQHHISKLFGI